MRANSLALIALLAAPAAADPVRIDISGDAVLGVSGIEVSGDGTRFLAVSDAGWFLQGHLERDGGTLTGGAVDTVLPISGIDGRPVAARRVGDWSDAEGLAEAPDGRRFVSFERWARVGQYDDLAEAAGFIKDHPDFNGFEDNRELEAVAVDPEGRLVTFPEGPQDGAFPVYRHDGTGWEVVASLPMRDAYSPVGADYAPDGTLWLLERKLVFATWFRSRLSRIGADWRPVTVWESGPGEMGNLEGVSVWEAPEGLRAVMVSDNNGRPGVPTEIVELRLTD